MKNKVYHFCAFHQPKPGQINYFDGVLSSTVDLRKKCKYDELKEAIGKGMNPPCEGHMVILLSLTVVG